MALQPALQAIEIESLRRMPAPTNAPAILLTMAQADGLTRIDPDGGHLCEPLGRLEVIHSRASLSIMAGQHLQRQPRIVRPVQRFVRQLISNFLTSLGVERSEE